jgi:hypothetical protein
LEASFRLADKACLERHFREYYGKDFIGVVLDNQDGAVQRSGVDGVVLLQSSTVSFDLKGRRKYYGDDIALEYQHVFPRGRRTPGTRFAKAVKRRGSPLSLNCAPGWVEKTLACDIVAYYQKPKDRMTVLPRRELQRAWFQNKDEWLDMAENWEDGFSIAVSPNDDYDSYNLVIPRLELLGSMFTSK